MKFVSGVISTLVMSLFATGAWAFDDFDRHRYRFPIPHGAPAPDLGSGTLGVAAVAASLAFVVALRLARRQPALRRLP